MRQFVPVLLVVLLAACAAPAARSAAGGDAGLVLRLCRDGSEFRCTVSNASAGPRQYLSDLLCHPLRLRLYRAGVEVGARDARAVMKFDNRPRVTMARTVLPGETVEAGQGVLYREGGQARLDWRPWSFRDLAPGDYAAEVFYEALPERLFDETDGEWRRPDDLIAKGPLVSNRVRFRVD